jgi:integrase/recombinase XerD
MAAKVNLKKYLAVGGRWQFVPVVKVKGRPRPDAVMIGGEAVRGTTGTFYLEWRENGKRVQKPCGVSSREALDAWETQSGIFDGTVEPEPQADPLPVSHVSIQSACEEFLTGIRATKARSTYEAYAGDLAWFRTYVRRSSVVEVRREDLIRLFALGREQNLSQSTINRTVMVGLMALRNTGAQIALKKGDWPKVPTTDVVTYDADEIRSFFKACNASERLLFQVYLLSGFRHREVSTLRWRDIDFQACTLSVCVKPEYDFKPKSYTCRRVRVPSRLIAELRARKKSSQGPLVFPTTPHPTRPNYGGGSENAHHLELCKEIAHRAKLNCGFCTTSKGKCSRAACCENWFLHKWRHTFATNMLQSGIDIKTLQVLLGHKNISTTEKYLRAVRLDELEQRVETSRLAAFLGHS